MASSRKPADAASPSWSNQNLPIDRNLLEAILKTSGAAITLVDDNGQIIFANDAAEQVLGIEKSSVTQRSYNAPAWKITDFAGHPFPETELPFVRVMATGEAVFDVQHAIESANGERRYLSINGSPLKDPSGRITQSVFSIVDITEQVQSERLQQEALEFYRQIFEGSPAVKLLIDPVTAAIVDANPAAANFYGYPIDVLKRMKITDINQQPLKDVQARMEQTRSQRNCCWHFPHRLASGEIRQVEVHASRLDLRGRELLYSIVHDITDRQRFEDALRSQLQQEQLLEDIAQAIRRSLDLKTVLHTTVNQVRHFLAADRVIIYRPTASGQNGSVLVESCSPDYLPLLGWEIGDTEIEQRRFVRPYQRGQAQAITDIANSDLDPAYKQLLEIFQVKSQLTIPILHTNSEPPGNLAFLGHNPATGNPIGANPFILSPMTPVSQIWGLLIVHHCAANHVWQDWEVNLLQRLEMQLAAAIQQAELYQQVQQLNTDLESQVRQRTIQLQKSLNSESVLRLITDKIHGTLSEAAILQTAVQKLALTLNVLSCHASLYQVENQTAMICYEYTDWNTLLVGTLIPMQQYLEIYQLLLQGEPLQFCLQRFRGYDEPIAILCYPIVDDEQGVLGDLTLLAPKERSFDLRDLQLVQQVTKQCAIALRQSRLYQAAQLQIQELEKLNQLKDDFLSTISHELRTPLSSIKLAAQLMNMYLEQVGEQLNPKIEQCLNTLQDECNREISLINNLLLLQQLNAKTHPVILSTVNLNVWFLQVLESFDEIFRGNQQTWQTDIAVGLPPITTDLFLLGQLIHELLTNACKFTPAGEVITIAVRLICSTNRSGEAHSRVQVSITNTGIEIAADQLPHVFDRFYRIPSDDPWKHGGTGLGLMLVKKLTQYLNGEIAVTSQVGQTCFTLKLPLQWQPGD